MSIPTHRGKFRATRVPMNGEDAFARFVANVLHEVTNRNGILLVEDVRDVLKSELEKPEYDELSFDDPSKFLSLVERLSYFLHRDHGINTTVSNWIEEKNRATQHQS